MLQRSHLAAVLVLCLFLGLAITYSTVNPVMEAPDELHHVGFAAHLAQGGALPVQSAGAHEAMWGQEGSQPPLYYALGALLISPLRLDDLAVLYERNPHMTMGVPLALYDKNLIVHTAAESFPWRGAVLAVHLLRLFSIVLASGTVLCTYWLARTIFPEHPALAVTAMAANAFTPMFVFMSSAANNDSLITLLASLVLVVLARLLVRGSSVRLRFGLGILIGFACLSKLSGLALLPLAFLALALSRLKEANWHPRAAWASWFGDCLTISLPVIAIAGWWYVRNWQLYGDVTGLSVMVGVVGGRSDPLSLTNLWAEFRGLRMSYWGLFGWFNVLMQPIWAYEVLDALALMAAAGLAIWLQRVRPWRRGRLGLPILVLVGWVIMVGISLASWTSATSASQGRLLFPTISALSLFIVLGLAQWLPGRHALYLPAAFVGVLLVLASASPFAAIAPAYAPQSILLRQPVPPGAQPLGATYGGKVRLVAYSLDRREVSPGESIRVTLYWQALVPMRENYSLYIQLLGKDGERFGQLDSYAGGLFPTSQWNPGPIIQETRQVVVTAFPPQPVGALLTAGLYEFGSGERLPVTDPQGQSVDQPVLTRVKIGAPTAPPTPQQTINANLENRVRLVGYDLPTETARAGAELPLTLYWEVLSALDADYTVFVHLITDDGIQVGGNDGPPFAGQYSTSLWGAGEYLADHRTLRVPADLSPGRYRISVGLYQPKTGQRLRTLDGVDSILIATLQVAE